MTKRGNGKDLGQLNSNQCSAVTYLFDLRKYPSTSPASLLLLPKITLSLYVNTYL
jgi:hypothetical protein